MHTVPQRIAFVSLFDLLEACHARIRVEVLLILWAGPTDVGSIAHARGLSDRHVSYHLQWLAGSGLVTFVKDGQRHIYSLSPQTSFRVSGEFLYLVMCGDDGSECQLKIPEGVAKDLGWRAAVPSPAMEVIIPPQPVPVSRPGEPPSIAS